MIVRKGTFGYIKRDEHTYEIVFLPEVGGKASVVGEITGPEADKHACLVIAGLRSGLHLVEIEDALDSYESKYSEGDQS